MHISAIIYLIMIKTLFTRLNTTVMGGAILISVFSVLSKVLGLVRDRMLAHMFGAGEILDAYFASFKIPDLIFNTLILGALASAFVPVFVKLNKKDNRQAIISSNSIFNIIVVLLSIITLIIFLNVTFFVKFLVPGFSVSQLQITISLTRIMLLTIIIFGASNVMSSLLNSYKSYFAYSLAPIFYNIGIIIGIILSKFYGLEYLAWGVVSGAFMHFLIQLIAVLRHGWKYKPVFHFKDYYVRRVFSLMIPRTIGLATGQISQVIITMIASTLVSGSIAVLTFGLNLESFIVGIFGVSISIAIFPILSDLAEGYDRKEFNNYLIGYIEKVCFYVIPLSVLMILLREPIVRIVLGSGNFSWENTYATAWVLGYFSFSLIFQCLIPILSRAFYAFENTAIPVIASIIALVINVVLAYILSQTMGVYGIAIAFSISNFINLIILLILLVKKYKFIVKKTFFGFLFKILSASFIMSFVVYFVDKTLPFGLNMSKFIGVFIHLTFSSIFGLGIYVIICFIFKINEVDFISHCLVRFEKSLMKIISQKKYE